MSKNILAAASITWCYSVLLGLFSVVYGSGYTLVQILHSHSSSILLIAILYSTFVAALLTPLVMWAFKTNLDIKDLIFHGGALFFLLLIFIAIAKKNANNLTFLFIGPVLLAIIGLVFIGVNRRGGFFR